MLKGFHFAPTRHLDIRRRTTGQKTGFDALCDFVNMGLELILRVLLRFFGS